MCRTIIYGAHANTVRRILFVLSYFIRCNEVFINKDYAAIDTWDLDDPLNLSGTSKESNATEPLSPVASSENSSLSNESSSNSRRTSESGFPFNVPMDDFINVPMPK
jgi:hypothetical protein